MKSARSERRKNRIVSVLNWRQPTLRLVVENVHDPHNVSAILRTCDAAGVPVISLIYNSEPFPKIGKKSSASALKWIELEKFKSVDECYSSLKKDGFRIFASSLNSESINLFDIDLTEKVALVVGNEHRGVSDQACQKADKLFRIPMYGMVQSLNVSVASAVILYEAVRQRYRKKMYDTSQYSDNELSELLNKWMNK
ncbi:MAG: RNA methyltransferase [Ignavibacteriaceae bacterium]